MVIFKRSPKSSTDKLEFPDFARKLLFFQLLCAICVGCPPLLGVDESDDAPPQAVKTMDKNSKNNEAERVRMTRVKRINCP